MPIQLLHFGRLYLSPTEAKQLAERLEHELVCRTVAQADDPVMVADVHLSPVEGWHLVDELEKLMAEADVNWLDEGF